MGCNTEFYQYGCAGYDKVTGIVANSYTTKTSCSKCYKSGNSQICTTYTCYVASVDWSVCVERIGTWGDESEAQNVANRYYKGLEMTLWVPKATTGECTSNSEKVSTDLPLTGIVFLSISGAFALTLIIVLIVKSLTK